MISTDQEFRTESVAFLNKEWENLNENFPFDFNSLALKYVKNSRDFKYKDDVEAGILVTCREEFGYLEFTEKKNNISLYSLTEKGKKFIEEKRKLKK